MPVEWLHNQFVSQVTDRCALFLDVLKGSKRFKWTDKCEKAFEAFKEHLGCPSLLSKPIEWKKLYLYLALYEEAVSAALVKEEEKFQ